MMVRSCRRIEATRLGEAVGSDLRADRHHWSPQTELTT
jgi:hypothetical protein